LINSWLSNMLLDAGRAKVITDDVLGEMKERLHVFNESYNHARTLAYGEPPFQYTHMFLFIVTAFCFSVPFALIDTFGRLVPVPSMVIAVAFFGLYEISRAMEKPFGFDAHDIKVDSMVNELHGKYVTAAHLALGGHFRHRRSTGGDLLAALLAQQSCSSSAHPECPSVVPSVHQYSLCRIPSIASDPSNGRKSAFVSAPVSYNLDQLGAGSAVGCGAGSELHPPQHHMREQRISDMFLRQEVRQELIKTNSNDSSGSTLSGLPRFAHNR